MRHHRCLSRAVGCPRVRVEIRDVLQNHFLRFLDQSSKALPMEPRALSFPYDSHDRSLGTPHSTTVMVEPPPLLGASPHAALNAAGIAMGKEDESDIRQSITTFFATYADLQQLMRGVQSRHDRCERLRQNKEGCGDEDVFSSTSLPEPGLWYEASTTQEEEIDFVRAFLLPMPSPRFHHHPTHLQHLTTRTLCRTYTPHHHHYHHFYHYPHYRHPATAATATTTGCSPV